jgi:capsular polysaccharide biosynthesis protein
MPNIYRKAKNFVYKILLEVDFAARWMPSFWCFQPARGFFSAIDGVRSEKLGGSILAEQQVSNLFDSTSVSAMACMNQHSQQPWPIFWAMEFGSQLVGRKLTWRNQANELCLEGEFFVRRRRKLSEDRLFAQILIPKKHRLQGAWTSIASNWNDGTNYYHWILDGLGRLAIRECLPEHTRILIPRKCPRYAWETLRLLELDGDAQESLDGPLEIERYYFLSPTAMTGVWNPFAYNWLRQRFGRFFCPANRGSPIFFTRRGVSRVPSNLVEIEKLFVSAGFNIVDCANYSVREQIEFASAAPAIAGLHGASMTNILWARFETPTLEIFQPDFMNGCYEQIANHCKLRYSYVVNRENVTINSIESWLASFSMDTDRQFQSIGQTHG